MDQQTQESSQEQVTASENISPIKRKKKKKGLIIFSCSPADCRCRRRRLLLYGTPEACLHSQIIPGACAHYEF